MQSYSELYVHMVWSTWDRYPLITPDIEERLYAVMHQECLDVRATPVAFGGMPEHINVLAQIPTTIAVADFTKQLKGVSSHFANHGLGMNGVFIGQGSYSAFSVSSELVSRARGYVLKQKAHHQANELYPEWELPDD